MGTIRTAIALYDGVTSPLQSMHKAMGVVLNTFESMQQASGRAVDTAAIREAREEWAKAGTAFDAIEENIRNANNEQQKFNNSIRGGNNSANGLLSTIKKIAVAAGGIVGINKVQNISDKLASTKARLNLLVDDGGSVDVLEQKIMASAQRSRSVYFDTASAVAKLGLNAGNAFNGDMNQVIAFMEQVNKQFVIGGATAQEQSNAMIQLTQAMAAGALRGEELNSILDGAPGIARAIEKGEARPLDFLWKMLLTALTMRAGYRGGEIVPAFSIGATFGCVAGGILGFSPELAAAASMVALFCGVTNCPITAMLISFELFGFSGAAYYLIAISISYAVSGYYSLYKDQTIVYSKYKARYINRKTR